MAACGPEPAAATLEQTARWGAWQAHSGSGNVRLALGSSGGFNMNLHTGSGTIHSDLPITVQGTMGKHELKGSVRGGGPEVEVSTGSGDIDIR